MVSFLVRKTFSGNLNEAISFAEIDVTLKVMSLSINEITSFGFSRNIFLQRKSSLTLMGAMSKAIG